MRLKLLWGFEIQTDHLISSRWPHLIVKKKKRIEISRIVDFAVLVDQWGKLKESKKRPKYTDIAKELKNDGTWR